MTKKAKKRATAVLMSLLSSPTSSVKFADSAFPIYRVSSLVCSSGTVGGLTDVGFVQSIEEEEERKEGQQ